MAIKFQKVLKVLGILSLLLGEPANLQEKKIALGFAVPSYFSTFFKL